ncbi:MAG TPA: neutral/alkaline non-lysosomal ceramidase N-terminal domain-containing protein [Terriglobales bacterium]|nr:neutral/alkaline non-lysosomal ceramidase N-terminal domain-containing protein [Terriglobales bacterium]
MRTLWRGSLVLLACLALACGDGDDDDAASAPQVQAGIAEVRMPAPVGIGTVGFFGVSVEAEPSPFARRYPATVRAHGYPSFRALVISRGPGEEVIFLRGDLVGVFQQFRRAVVLNAEARLGRSIDDALIFGATHTHSGPGRILDGGGVFDLIADSFFPEFYQRMVEAAATAIVDAYANLAPARVGYAVLASAAAHSDRRCEDGLDHTNDALPVVAVERAGEIDAVLVSYAVHSTALGIDQLTLSRDVAGAIEEQVEGRFDHPVLALYFNSWGADMSPGNPEVPLQIGATEPNGYERMNKVGYEVAATVQQGLAGIAWQDDPEIFAEVQRFPLNRAAIGYGPGEFPFEYGGVFCGGLNSSVDCDPLTTQPGIDQQCIPFPASNPVPPQTEISAGRIGELAFVTFPGEPGTLLAEELIGRIEQRFGEQPVMLLGYSQDYTGYSILEDDWHQGGYEAGGGLWGPRQGEYLVDAAERVFERVVVARAPSDPNEPAPLPPFDIDPFTPYAPAAGEAVGTIATDVAASYGASEVVVLTVQGSDPWLGAPTATLVTGQGEPVLHGGQPIDSNGYAFWIDLVPQPGYREARTAPSRTFLWTFSMPVSQTVPGLLPDLGGGTYRLRVTIPTATGEVEATSSVFTIA